MPRKKPLISQFSELMLRDSSELNNLRTSLAAPLPVDSDDEENEQEEEDVKMEEKVVKKEEAQNEESDEEEEEDEEDEEETYIVEKIMEHRSDFEDGKMRYSVKWKGWEKKSERTWEPEENLEGARDILEEYWESVGGKPIPGQDEKPTKKRGRQSGASTKPEKDTAKRTRTGKGAKQENGRVEQDVDPGPMYGFTEVGEDSWKPPPAKDGSWDDLVQSVDTVVRENSDGKLYGFLIWKEISKEGRFYRSKATVDTIYRACPQRMLRFYEKHLVFSAPGDDADDAKDSS